MGSIKTKIDKALDLLNDDKPEVVKDNNHIEILSDRLSNLIEYNYNNKTYLMNSDGECVIYYIGGHLVVKDDIYEVIYNSAGRGMRLKVVEFIYNKLKKFKFDFNSVFKFKLGIFYDSNSEVKKIEYEYSKNNSNRLSIVYNKINADITSKYQELKLRV
jgi:hypothetical protein